MAHIHTVGLDCARTPRERIRRSGRPGERGMVTAELAIGSMVAAFLVVLGVWSINLVLVQTRCADVATQVARQLARGDASAADQARGRAPEGARVSVARAAATVSVTVAVDASFGIVGPVHLQGRAVADVEPGVKP